MNGLRAGAAHIDLVPPLGLPMIGYVRQEHGARGYGLPLEAGALVLESEGGRIVLCGVDVVGTGGAGCDELVARVAAATGADPSGVLLNWSHTHLAPPIGPLGVWSGVDDATRASTDAYARVLADTVVSVCRQAAERLEPAAAVWGQGQADLAVNRRERTPGGPDGNTVLGWNPDELVDTQLTVLQARRSDESPIATLVGYGCHPVTCSWDVLRYSADFPGPMRRLVRGAVGGDCIFFQGAGGNVLPRFCFTGDEAEAVRMGTQLGVAALAAVVDRRAYDVEITSFEDRSATPYHIYRREPVEPGPAVLGSASEVVTVPLLPHPTLEEVEEELVRREADLEAAREEGVIRHVKVAYYWAAWARSTAAALRDGTAPTEVLGPGARGAHRRRRRRHRPRRDVRRVRAGGEGALAREPHPVRGVHERAARLPADGRRVRVRRLRGGLRSQGRRAPVPLRPRRRADLRRDRRQARRVALPGGDAVGSRARLDRVGNVPLLEPPPPLEHPARRLAAAR